MPALVRSAARRRTAPRRRLRLDALEARDVPATHIDFVADPTQSYLTLSGDLAGSTLQQQGAGSLTSSYTGSIAADIDFGAGTINIDPTNTSLAAGITGNWKPNVGGGSGTAPADYGGKVTIVIFDVWVAVRDVIANMTTGGPVAMSGSATDLTFPSTETMAITGGTADYDASSIGQGSGSSAMAGNSGTNAAGTDSTFSDLGGGAYRLTIPVDLTINTTVSGQNATLHMVGQVVADGSIPSLDLNGPTATGNDGTGAFTEDAGPAPIVTPDMTVTRAGPGNLTGATIQITNLLDGTDESLDVNLGASGLSKAYSNGTLTISGSAPVSTYQDVLRTATYNNASDHPDTTARKVTFAVSAGLTISPTQTSTVSVTPTEDNVIIDPIPDQTTNEWQTLTVTATGSDPDFPGAVPTFSLVNPPAGASITAGGVLTFTPDDTMGGSVIPITVKATDVGGTTATTVMNVTVVEINMAPVLPDLGDVHGGEGSTLTIPITATDVDIPADTLTYGLVNPPAGAHIDPATGAFTFDPVDGPFTTSVTVTVSDNGTPQLSDTKTFNVVIDPVAPSADFGNNGPVREDQPALLSFTNATDPSAADLAAGFTYSFDLNNDGDFTDPGEVADSTTPTLSVTFKNDGSKVIHGRITDRDGASRDYTQTLSVTNIDLVVATFDRGGPSTVRILDATTLAPKFPAFQAYDAKFRGGVVAAVGDWTGDGVPDVIVAPGPGGSSKKGTTSLKVYDGSTGAEVPNAFANPMPFGDKYRRGYNLAVGDFNGDHKIDLAVAPRGGTPIVVIIDGATHTALPAMTVLPATGAYKSGVRIAAGDVDGDGRPELIVTGGAGAKTLIRVLDVSTGQPVPVRPDLVPFGDLKTVRSGVYVTAGDLNGDGKADLIVGVMSGPPIMRTFDGVTTAILGTDTQAQGAKFKGGLRVAAVDVTGDGKAEIITATGKSGLKAEVQRLDGTTFTVIDDEPADPLKVFKGGAFVAAGR